VKEMPDRERVVLLLDTVVSSKLTIEKESRSGKYRCHTLKVYNIKVISRCNNANGNSISRTKGVGRIHSGFDVSRGRLGGSLLAVLAALDKYPAPFQGIGFVGWLSENVRAGTGIAQEKMENPGDLPGTTAGDASLRVAVSYQLRSGK